MSKELENCPFCGFDLISIYGKETEGWTVMCEGCMNSTAKYQEKQGAIAAWNERPTNGLEEAYDKGFVEGSDAQNDSIRNHLVSPLEDQIDGFWEALTYSYNIESREEIEKDTKESWSEGTSPLAVALHFIWKRDPKNEVLIEALEEIQKVQSRKLTDGVDTAYWVATQALIAHREGK